MAGTRYGRGISESKMIFFYVDLTLSGWVLIK